MKKFMHFAVLGLASMLATSAFAQLGQADAMRADIGFNFKVGESLLPAGSYYFTTIGDKLTIRDATGAHNAIVHVMRENIDSVQQGNSLRFDRRNGVLALADVRWNGSAAHLQLIDTRTSHGHVENLVVANDK